MRVDWFEIQVPDLADAQRFYGAAFGWTFSPMGEGYVVATEGGAPVAGLSETPGDTAGRHVRVYLGTDELEATLEKITKAGGSVVQGRTLITEEYGWYATVADPTGLQFGLMTSKPA